jgi:hypothetical protein
VNSTSIPPTTIPVNDNPPTAGASYGLEKPDRRYLPDMIRLALDRLENASTAALRAVRGAEMAKVPAEAINDQAAACKLGATVDAIEHIPDWLAVAQQDLEWIRKEHAPESDRLVAGVGGIEGNNDDDDVAGFLAVGPSTPDRVIDGFIAAVGADRVLGALDRLTAPAKVDTASN